MAAGQCHVSPFAGRWYPGSERELRSLLERSFRESEERTGANAFPPGVLGLVVPHAGPAYSGTVAAAAYRLLRASPPERVVLLGFSHSGADAGLAIPDISGYETPLGPVAVDSQGMAELASRPGFERVPEELVCDHSIEIQLPFLQFAAPGVRVLPLYVSRLSGDARQRAAEALAGLAGPGTVWAASSDFTHFGRSFHFQPFPVDDDTPERLYDLDHKVIEAASSLREDVVAEALAESGATVCGQAPIRLLLALLRLLESGSEIFQSKLDYRTSGEVTGEFEHSVSYAALGYHPYSRLLLSEEDGQALLASARATLDAYLATGQRRPIPGGRQVERRAGAFVTLHQGRELRGCVGRPLAAEPLSRSVPELTLTAALDDLRFEPVRKGEGGLEIEISVLSPLRRIKKSSEFRVREHGAMLETNFHRGLLLPQVAEEHDWDAEQFLAALNRKAGVTQKGRGGDTPRIAVFRAQILK